MVTGGGRAGDGGEQEPVYTAPSAPSRSRAGLYPPTFFFPEPVEHFPPETEDPAAPPRQARRRRNHRSVAQRPPVTITPREFRLILSGIPLSLTNRPP